MKSTMGCKATRTKKCNCDNHKWGIFELRETSSNEAVVTIWCQNCSSLWDTKSVDAIVLSLMKEKDIKWYIQVLKNRLDYQHKHLEDIDEQILKFEKEKSKVARNIEKINKQLGELEV